MDKIKDYAIINTGSKQYKVQEGDKILVELLDDEPGKKVKFSSVLLLQSSGKTKVGTPTVTGASVEGKIEEKVRGDKIVVFKKKRRKGYKKTAGHRQNFHVVTIGKISAGEKKAKSSTDTKSKAKTATKTKSKTTAVKTEAKPVKAKKTEAKAPKSSAKKKTEQE